MCFPAQRALHLHLQRALPPSPQVAELAALALRLAMAMRATLSPCAEEPAPAEFESMEIIVDSTAPCKAKSAAPQLKLHLPPPDTSPAARIRALLCFVGVMVLTASYSLLVEASKDASGAFSYKPLSVTFTAETTKLAVSLLMLRAAVVPPPALRASDLARAAVPALLYLLQNNAAFAALRYLTPPLYQLLSNLKIVATALLSCVVLHRVFSRLQVRFPPCAS